MRKRNRVLLVLLCASPMAIVAVGAVAPSLALVPSGTGANHADARHILEERSPGARSGGTTQSKLARAVTPTQRVLSQVRERPAAPTPAEAPRSASASSLATVPVAHPLDALGPLGPDLDVRTPGGFIGGGPAPLLVVDSPLSGGGGGGSDRPTNPVTPAVPEPVTWMTMLTGLAVIAWRLRRNRGSAVSVVAPALWG